jgi:hypothetical protein
MGQTLKEGTMMTNGEKPLLLKWPVFNQEPY